MWWWGPPTRFLVCAALGLALGSGPALADNVTTGEKALKAGRLDDAMKNFEAAAQAGSAPGQAGMGRVWLRRGRYEKATEAFQRAATMDPAYAFPIFGQGEVLRRQGRCEEALPLLRKATRMDRRFPEAQLGLGSCLAATGHAEEAIAALSEGMKWSREWAPRFLAARGAAQMARDSLRAAGVDFTQARELAPKDPEIRKATGDFYVQRGTWALAIPEYEAAVSLDANDVETWASLGQALYYGERYDESLKAFRHATTLDPGYMPAQLGLGNLLFRAGTADPRRFGEAREPLERYTQLAPEDPKGWSLLGRLYARMGIRDSAMATMLKAERLGDRNRELYTALGKAYSDRKEWVLALDAFSKGDPGPEDEAMIAQIFEVTGRPASADSVYLRILARDSTSARAAFAYTQRAKLRFRDKDYPAAAALFGQAIAIDPRSGEAHFYRGLCFKELDRNAEALASLRTAAEIDSAKPDRFFWLGVLSDAAQVPADAERAFLRVTELDSTSALAGKAFRQLGFYRLLKKQWTTATPLLRRAVTLDPSDTQAWLWLGQGYQNAGNRPKASEAYQRVLALDPKNTIARNGLKSLEARKPPRPS
jgi:tetratricopeptide (TPR) repeat protein